MPWKASSVMEERLRFVGRLLDGESMTDVCREFGISRKTGYKIFDRYKEHGLEALTDRSRRPVRYANQLPPPIEGLIVRLKADKPHWGARKIRELLVRRLDGDVRVPAKSTIHAVLDRHGLVKRGGGPRHRARRCPKELPPTISGAPTSRASSSSATAAIATRSPSPTMPRAFCCSARRSNRFARIPPSQPLNGCFVSAECRWRSAPTTAFPSPAQCPVQSIQAVGVVVAPRHRHRTHQAWPAATKWPPRAHASYPREGSDPSGRHEQPATAGPLRCFRARV